MKKHVSVVIPTIDEPDELRECFELLSGQTYNAFCVLVVDSGSGINQSVVEEYSDSLDVTMTSVQKNGLPRARNYAVSRLNDTDIVAFCDPDARPVPKWIDALVAEYANGVGAVGGPVLNPGTSLRPRDTVGMVHSNGEVVANFDAIERQSVQHLRGTNMSFDIEVLREIGGFDPAYRGTAHFEDTDATYAVHRAGYDVIYTPDAELEHDHPREERDIEEYHQYRLSNWPVLFEKTSPSMSDRLSFYGRWLGRRAWAALRV